MKPGECLEFDCTQSHSASVITTDKLASSRALIYDFIPTEQHNPIELLKYSMIPYLYYTNHKDIYCSKGSFDVKTRDTKLTVSHKYCKQIHLMDGYSYA